LPYFPPRTSATSSEVAPVVVFFLSGTVLQCARSIGCHRDVRRGLPNGSCLLSWFARYLACHSFFGEMASDPSSFVGAQVKYFLKCTTEAVENDPKLVLGNVRQFINGLKNYLVKQDEASLHFLIENERCKLASNQFLNIDAILEGVLQKIILDPLKPYLYQLLIKESSKNGTLHSLSENMAAVRNKSPEDIGLQPIDFDIPMEQIREEFRRMQHHYSPVKKLEYLLRALSLAYPKSRVVTAVNCYNFDLPDADELLRWLVYLLSRCSVVGCEIEANYMWGLLHPALLFGEASYCLTALSSAVHVLKHAHLVSKLSDTCHFASEVLWRFVPSPYVESVETTGAFLRIAIPEEVTGAIYYHCFPAVPDMSCAKLCRMIAHKFKITNPEDYGLYLNVDGYESAVLPADCPDVMRAQLRALKKFHLFVYKRHEAKIAWPKMTTSEMD
uniref:Mab-21 domain-containing protein n=1 Tax=Soboliphyme baturini TaxID=241478 RepID=A0A183IEI1_9BILA